HRGVGPAEMIAEGETEGRTIAGVEAFDFEGGRLADAIGWQEPERVDAGTDEGGIDAGEGAGGGAETVGGGAWLPDLGAVALGVADGAGRSNVRDGPGFRIAQCRELFQGGHAVELGRRHTEVETVQLERLGDLLLDDAGEGAAVGALGHATK